MSDKKDLSYKIPGGIECPRCHTKLTDAEDVTPGAGNHFRKGKILVCGSCTLIGQVGDSKFIPLTLDQIKSLPKMLQTQLLAVCRKLAESMAERN